MSKAKALPQPQPAPPPRLVPTKIELDSLRRALNEHAIVAFTDAAGHITFVNDKFCEISKYTRDELLGQNHRIINSGHHSREFFAEMWSTISSGKVWKGDIRNRAKDGTLYWVATTIVPFLDLRGRPYQYASIRTDITSQKYLEAELRKANATLEKRVEERTNDLKETNHQLRLEILERERMEHEVQKKSDDYLNLIESANDAMVLIDTETRRILYANGRCADLVVCPREELVGMPYRSFTPEDQTALHDALFDRTADAPVSTLDSDMAVRQLGGARVPVELSTAITTWNGRRAILIVLRDVSERRRLEAALRREISMVEILKSVAIASNEAASVEQVIPRVLKLIAEICGWHVGHAYRVEPGDRLVSTGLWYEAKAGSTEGFRALSEATVFKTGDGLIGRVHEKSSPEWIVSTDQAPEWAHHDRCKAARAGGLQAVLAFPVLIGREVTHVLELYSRDAQPVDGQLLDLLASIGVQIGRVVERARTRDLLAHEQLKLAASAKMAALGEMAAGMAHEINNPLTIISVKSALLQSRLAKNELDVANLAAYALSISSTATRIAKIVKGLRNFSREAENDPYELVPVRLILEDALSICRERFRNHSVALDIADPPLSLQIQCRPAQIAQVFLNLLNNAFDAVRDLDLRHVAVETADRGDTVMFSVTDSGRGIAADTREKLFQPFFSTKDVGRGTGLGLSISKGIIEAHRGQLFLDPATGTTRFTFILPKRHS